MRPSGAFLLPIFEKSLLLITYMRKLELNSQKAPFPNTAYIVPRAQKPTYSLHMFVTIYLLDCLTCKGARAECFLRKHVHKCQPAVNTDL